MSGSILYKRNYDMTFLRCMDAKEANHMIEEVQWACYGQEDPKSRLLLAHHGE